MIELNTEKTLLCSKPWVLSADGVPIADLLVLFKGGKLDGLIQRKEKFQLMMAVKTFFGTPCNLFLAGIHSS